jgi:hypothetical protein
MVLSGDVADASAVFRAAEEVCARWAHLPADDLVLKSRQNRAVSMGGRGSGGHNSKGKLRDVQCARLDVHELAREGKLKLRSRTNLTPTCFAPSRQSPAHV